MMVPARLPVAPRPFRDELLSSWVARVAARYGSEPLELMVYQAGQGVGTQTHGRLTMWRRTWGRSGFGRKPAGSIRNGFGAGHWLPDILIGRGTGY